MSAAIDSNTGTVVFQVPGITWTRQATEGANSWLESGQDDLKTERRTADRIGNTLEYSFPLHSVVSLEIDGR
jgi:hypothetical protein